jgi:mitochondrial fission protein ELM1
MPHPLVLRVNSISAPAFVVYAQSPQMSFLHVFVVIQYNHDARQQSESRRFWFPMLFVPANVNRSQYRQEYDGRG